MILDNPPVSMATAKGHLDLTRAGIQSTTKPQRRRRKKNNRPTNTTTNGLQEGDDLDQSSPTNNYDDEPPDPDSDHTVLLAVTQTSELALHADLTGRFPITSRHGNSYILVSTLKGYIHMEPMPSRHATHYTAAVQRTIEFFRTLGHHPTYFRIDNETSRQLERMMATERIIIEYVPPNNHRANKAERAIRSAKNHIIASLASVHPSCPLFLWDDFLPQIELSLNLLRPAPNQPTMSAFKAIHGRNYDFAAHPIAPVGTQVLAHDPPSNRPSWAPHGTPGFYTGPSLQHYRSYRVYIPSTTSERVTDSVEWLPTPFHMPGSTTAEILLDTLHSTQNTLQMIAPSVHPATTDDPRTTKTLQQLTDTLASLVKHLTPTSTTAEVASTEGSTHHEAAPPTLVPHLPHLPAAASTTDDATPAVFPPPGLPLPQVPKHHQHNNTNDNISPTVVGATPRPARSIDAPIIQQQPSPPTDRGALTPPPETQTRDNILTNTRHRPARQRALPQRFRSANHTVSQEVHRALTAATLDTDGTPLTYRKAKRGPNKSLWEKAEHEELCRLVEETKTMFFIPREQVPHDRKVSYYNPQVKIKTKNGSIQYRIRGTYGGNISDYPYSVTAFTADLQSIKILLNAVVTENGYFMTADVKDFYLGTDLPHYEYMRLHRSQIPSSSALHFQLAHLWHNDHVYVEIRKGIYGLPQAGKLAQDRLIAHLCTHGYYSSPETPCLFRHKTRDISFALVVDDFGIKFHNKDDVHHLLTSLRELYTITEDWTGSKYVGLTIDHNRHQHTLTLSIPNYVDKACQRFNITAPNTPPTTPMVYVPPQHGRTGPQPVTTDTPDPNDRPLTPAELTRLQQILGVFLFYARAVDYVLLTALNKLSSQQANPTLSTLHAAHRLVSYAASHPNASITFYPSSMQLHVHSDASYLSERQARSRAGGIFFLPRLPSQDSNKQTPPLLNGLLDATTTIIRSIVASACEAEYAALFLNCQHAVSLCHILNFLGYTQQPTPVVSDNSCAVNIANGLAKPGKSKAMNMRYHWVRDRVKAGEFTIAWAPGDDNLADFFTKIVPSHVTTHFRKLISTPLKEPYSVPSSHVPLLQEGVLDKQSTRQAEVVRTRTSDTNDIHKSFRSLDVD